MSEEEIYADAEESGEQLPAPVPADHAPILPPIPELPPALAPLVVHGPSALANIAQINIARNLVQLVKQLVREQAYDGVKLLFTGASEAARNCAALGTGNASEELLHDVCLQNLNEANYDANMPLFACAEELMKIIAHHAPADELLLELIEMIEVNKSEHVFTAALRSLQQVLLRLGGGKPRAVEWSLNAVRTRLGELPLPACLTDGYDDAQRKLLEQDAQIERLLMHFITVGLFYEPLVREITRGGTGAELFHNCGSTRCNVLACFLVQLLGKPLALLDLTKEAEGGGTNTYTLQCARNLTAAATQCIGDAFYWLNVVEQRRRFVTRFVRDDAKDGEVEKPRPNRGPRAELISANVFQNELQFPLTALGIYYYVLLVDGVGLAAAPKVYTSLYIFESCLYLSEILVESKEPALQLRGVQLTRRTLELMGKAEIPSVSLELEVHQYFCCALCRLIGHASQLEVRQQSLQLLRQYILQFDDDSKYIVLKNLLQSVGHNGITGYLSVMYKDMVWERLRASDGPLPAVFSGRLFRSMILRSICHLPQGAQTDLLAHADAIISTLNALRFFSINDKENRTGFWDFLDEVERDYVAPLRKALDISVAHYKAELVANARAHLSASAAASEDAADDEERAQLQLLDVEVPNAGPGDGRPARSHSGADRQRKTELLNQYLCTFDLMRSLLARATECVRRA